MSKRGYEVIILRDCGTGMESFESQDGVVADPRRDSVSGDVRKYSVTSTEMIEALQTVGPQDS